MHKHKLECWPRETRLKLIITNYNASVETVREVHQTQNKSTKMF
jgi:hypothetical protein